ncbi:hypothetical protein HBI25_237430 [Parastagonospora nodorum]|nr:hypothetical protein HBH54_235190 [Parastagonospora nodorum]KAH3938896.1 hypothetical protein HBH53_243690 [Parastagonospora nodorum]KAH3991033.1 hypothetical protein HBI10_240040 [Parastagonospora nodorum]KAH4008272.1 hypothetical protein HBI13_239590 [Parastagonospora nodorum]KAH4010983.1 hypothetical protein HBI09_229870 [Parastagonospora nodorum]
MLKTLTAHVKWLFNENEVKYLRSSLSVAQEGMRGFSNITAIDNIKEEIRMINAVIARGDRQAIQALEDHFGATLEETVDELKQTSQNRRRQRRAINSRMQDATPVLQEQRMRIGVSAIIPESKLLFTFDEVVEKYAKEIWKQRQTDTVLNAHPRQQSTRVDSFQPTNSTTSSSFASKFFSCSPPIEIASPATSTEKFDKALSRCVKCTGVCVCSEVDSHPVILTRPSSPDSAPSPHSTGFEHPSHRFDRSWQQPEKKNAAYQSSKSTCSPSDGDPCESRQAIREPAKPDPKMERVMTETEDLLAGVEADRFNNLKPGKIPNDEEYESDYADEEDAASEDEARPSPFQPVAGVQGRFPRNWRNRHERSESPDDHWHRKL